MICCDSCLDWYHGKCVGITKKMGKEMEEADHQWTCPKCKTKEEKQNTAQLKDKLKERQTKVITKENITAAGNTTNTTSKPQKPNKSMRRSLSKDKETSGIEPKKEEKKCFVGCDKLPIDGSIYCSEKCITKHANKAVELFKKTKPKGTVHKSHVLVMDPLTNTMLNGPNAPTEATLHTWLQSHPTFHVVLPKSDTRSKFYGTNTSKFYGKKLAPKHEAHTKVSSEKVKKALLIQNSPPEKKPSLSGIGSTTTTKVMTASLEKSDKKISIEKKNEPEKSDKKIIVIKPKTENLKNELHRQKQIVIMIVTENHLDQHLKLMLFTLQVQVPALHEESRLHQHPKRNHPVEKLENENNRFLL